MDADELIKVLSCGDASHGEQAHAAEIIERLSEKLIELGNANVGLRVQNISLLSVLEAAHSYLEDAGPVVMVEQMRAAIDKAKLTS